MEIATWEGFCFCVRHVWVILSKFLFVVAGAFPVRCIALCEDVFLIRVDPQWCGRVGVAYWVNQFFLVILQRRVGDLLVVAVDFIVTCVALSEEVFSLVESLEDAVFLVCFLCK